jgi:hypothetical protein
MTAEEVTAASLDPGLPHGFVISDQLGTGLNWYSAYDLCQNYSNGGFDDWSIPSESQLLKLYDNKDIIGSTLIADWVWGAEYEYATSKAYQVHMGFKFEAVVGKIDHTGEVYAVRSF